MELVLITGISKGLGLAICEQLLEKGYKVIGTLRTINDEVKRLLNKYPSQFFYEEFDFTNIQGIKTLVKKITKEYGHIYALINNAALGYDGILGTMHEKQIKELIQVNIEAPIILTKYVSRSMLLKLKGRIINIGSIIADTGFSGLSVYGASKSSLNGFTKSLSRELGKANITVNCIAPGYMKTDMTSGLKDEKLIKIKRRSSLGDLVSVLDVANMVSYLLSDEGEKITGTVITIDAGSTA